MRIPLELFTENLVTKQVMYIWTQALLQNGNLEDNVALTMLHFSSFLIAWPQWKRERYKQKIIYAPYLDIVVAFPRKGSIT